MTPRKARRIKEIESEYGMPFECILRDFARDNSYYFTCKTLGLAPDKWREYYHLFTPYKQGEREWLSQRNRDTATRHGGKTVAQWADLSGCSISTIKTRIRRGWSIDRLGRPPQSRGDTRNFKGKRDNDYFRMKINQFYESMP